MELPVCLCLSIFSAHFLSFLDDNVVRYIIQRRQELGFRLDVPMLRPDMWKTMRHLDELVTREQESGKDTGDFVYCLPYSRVSTAERLNSSELQVVSAIDIEDVTTYWTVSATSVVRVGRVESMFFSLVRSC